MGKTSLCVFYLLVSLSSCFSAVNNVCKTRNAYLMKRFSNKCWYNPDVDLLVPDIIENHGYPFESHDVITKDGYIVTLFRIPGRKNSVGSTKNSKQPVFLQHGVFSTSAPFVINGNESIAFILADEDYDVWLGNSRGTIYSKGHINMSMDDPRFWNFSYHESGVHDIPAFLDLISNVTKRNDTIFIGQSMGTTMQYVYTSELPEHAESRVKLIISLAPTVFLEHIRTPMKYLARFWPQLMSVGQLLELRNIAPNSPYLKDIILQICFASGFQLVMCESLVYMLFGFDFQQMPAEILPLVFSHWPAASSVNTVVHLMQGVVSKRFAHFDHGKKLNLKYYNSTTPPDYNVSRITVPCYLVYGPNDWVSSEKDIYVLYNKLQTKKSIRKVPYRNFNHLDFFFAKDLMNLLMNDLLNFMENYRSSK